MGIFFVCAFLSTCVPDPWCGGVSTDASLKLDAELQPWSAVCLQGTETLLPWEYHRNCCSLGIPNTTLYGACYFVGDLSISDSELLATLNRVVAPESWNQGGGCGNVRYLAARKAILVNQAAAVHEDVARFLAVVLELLGEATTLEQIVNGNETPFPPDLPEVDLPKFRCAFLHSFNPAFLWESIILRSREHENFFAWQRRLAVDPLGEPSQEANRQCEDASAVLLRACLSVQRRFPRSKIQ